MDHDALGRELDVADVDLTVLRFAAGVSLPARSCAPIERVYVPAGSDLPPAVPPT